MGGAIGIEARAASAAPWTLRRVVTAGVIGNVLEWYDFAVYGFFAPILAAQFFPAADPRVSLLAAFAAFAVGFLMRPVRSEEHTSELQSQSNLVCRLLLEKKKKTQPRHIQ